MDERTKEFCGCLYYSASALARAVTRIAAEEFAVTGLSPSHALLLMSVNKHPGIQPNELAAAMMLEPSTITRLIEKVEALGLVERKQKGKVVHIFSTTEGKRKQRILKAAWADLDKRYAAVLGKKSSDQLTASIYEAAGRLG